jgi:dihydroorotate dehydrogenase
MFSKIRPFIFKLDPELAHDLAIKALKTNLIVKDYKKNELILKTKLFGKEIPNPIGIAAGFDKNAEVYNPLFKLGFGFVEVGTVTPLSQYGNPKPRVFRLEEDCALINRLGFNNNGADDARSRIIKKKPIGMLGVNIGPNWNSENKIEDYLNCLRKFHDIADYITINISSPNTENLRDFHNNEELKNLLESIHNEREKLKSDIPIAIKISPDINQKKVEEICRTILDYGIKAVIVSNTTDGNRDSLKNHKKFQKGGLSGKPLNEISNKLINNFYKILNNKIDIIGVGGVDSGETAYQKFLHGAKFVQLYTGMVFEGPKIVSKISDELNNILETNNVKKLSDIVGKI